MRKGTGSLGRVKKAILRIPAYLEIRGSSAQSFGSWEMLSFSAKIVEILLNGRDVSLPLGPPWNSILQGFVVSILDSVWVAKKSEEIESVLVIPGSRKTNLRRRKSPLELGWPLLHEIHGSYFKTQPPLLSAGGLFLIQGRDIPKPSTTFKPLSAA